MMTKVDRSGNEIGETQESDYILTDDQSYMFNLLNRDLDANGHVPFGEVARNILGEQNQYISRHLSGNLKPDLSEGLRVNTSGDYHDFTIHLDDVVEFVARLRAYRRHHGSHSL